MTSSVVTLSNLPTLRGLFANGTLKATTSAQYPAATNLLDRVSLYQGDITKLQIDAIVNAANSRLLGGGGVDGAIHRAAGKGLYEECCTLNGCETGDAKITKGYNLPAKCVIHTVGPVYSHRHVELKASQLASCYRKSLDIAVKNSLKHICFPSISTGIYGYPIEDATRIALDVTRQFLNSENGALLDLVIFTVFSDADKEVYRGLIPEYFPAEI